MWKLQQGAQTEVFFFSFFFMYCLTDTARRLNPQPIKKVIPSTRKWQTVSQFYNEVTPMDFYTFFLRFRWHAVFFSYPSLSLFQSIKSSQAVFYYISSSTLTCCTLPGTNTLWEYRPIFVLPPQCKTYMANYSCAFCTLRDFQWYPLNSKGE